VVFAAVMLVGLLWNEWAFLALVAVIMVLCLREYFRLMNGIGGRSNSLAGWTITIALIGLAAVGYESFFPSGYWDGIGYETTQYLPGAWQQQSGRPVPAFWEYNNPALWPILLCAPVVLLLAGSLSAKRTLVEGAQSIAALGYILLPCLLLLRLYYLDPAWPLVLILCIWTNDTMAYIVGSLIGRTPFSPISPKKTWEGTAGGAILTIAGAALWARLSGYLPMAEVVGVAVCAAVFGTLGDLFESKLKRLAGVKDSGKMMPGHGGALDRFDSLLVAAPFAFCYLWLIRLCA